MVVVMIVIILKYFYHPYLVLRNPNPKLQSKEPSHRNGSYDSMSVCLANHCMDATRWIFRIGDVSITTISLNSTSHCIAQFGLVCPVFVNYLSQFSFSLQ